MVCSLSEHCLYSPCFVDGFAFSVEQRANWTQVRCSQFCVYSFFDTFGDLLVFGDADVGSSVQNFKKD